MSHKSRINDIARHFSMHRNSVRNIMKLYSSSACPLFKEKIEDNISFSAQELETLWSFLLPKSRKPHSHPKQASILQEKKIQVWYEKAKMWSKRLKNCLERRNELGDLSLAQIRWVYKRNKWKIRKVRTKTWESRSLYNYQEIWAFEHGHIDTKVLADAKSLPASIYENLKHNSRLPLYEWNIMFAGCRARFTAYSRGKSSTFGLQFLVLVLSHLRSCWVKGHVFMQTDGWVEFFSGSPAKQIKWNEILYELDTCIESYNPHWDIRKNLIERSHRSDDEEFLIPFWDEMKTKKQFMKHAQQYNDYWNKQRFHSGSGMNNMTPKEKLIQQWFHQVDRILDFEVLFLDSHFERLQRHLEYFYFQRKLRLMMNKEKSIDRKNILQLITQYSHLSQYAQNVLTYYPKH